MPSWLKWTGIFLSLMIIIAIPLVLFEEDINELIDTLIVMAADDPLPTASIVVLALTSDVLFPVPNGIIYTLAGTLFGWTFGAVVIWTGLMLGSTLGYGFGLIAAKPVTRKLVGDSDMDKAHELSERMGAAALVVTRTVPMIGDIFTIAAGITSYPFKKYLLIVSLANLGVAVVYGWIGATAIETGSELLAFIGAVGIPLVAWLGYQVFQKVRAPEP